MADVSGESDIESTIRRGRGGELSLAQLIGAFVDETVLIPSASDPSRGPLTPIMFQTPGGPRLAVFTSFAAIGEFGKQAPFAMTSRVSDLLRTLAPGIGIVVNPGNDAGFEMDADAVALAKQSPPAT